MEARERGKRQRAAAIPPSLFIGKWREFSTLRGRNSVSFPMPDPPGVSEIPLRRGGPPSHRLPGRVTGIQVKHSEAKRRRSLFFLAHEHPRRVRVAPLGNIKAPMSRCRERTLPLRRGGRWNANSAWKLAPQLQAGLNDVKDANNKIRRASRRPGNPTPASGIKSKSGLFLTALPGQDPHQQI